MNLNSITNVLIEGNLDTERDTGEKMEAEIE